MDSFIHLERTITAARARWGERRYRLRLGRREMAALERFLQQSQGWAPAPGQRWHYRGYEVIATDAPHGVVVEPEA